METMTILQVILVIILRRVEYQDQCMTLLKIGANLQQQKYRKCTTE